MSVTSSDILVQAAYTGSFTLLAQKLADGADADALGDVDGLQGTPLLAASFRGHDSCVQALLEGRAQFDLPGRGGDWDTPLYNASIAGQLECARLLIDAGAQLHGHEFPPLYVAASHGQHSCVHLLLEAGASADEPVEDGFNPLCIAAEHGYAACVQALVDGRADVNYQLADLGNPLWLAAQGQHEEGDSGVEVNEEDAAGSYEECVSILLAANASVDGARAGDDMSTPLYVAAQNGHESVLRLLLEAGADRTITRFDGETPKEGACRNEHEGCVRLLNRNQQRRR